MLIQKGKDSVSEKARLDPSNEGCMIAYVNSLTSLVPDQDDLALIFQMTEQAWLIWIESQGMTFNPERHQSRSEEQRNNSLTSL